jgi:hypothetical protein
MILWTKWWWAGGALIIAMACAVPVAVSAQNRQIVQCLDPQGHASLSCGWRYAASYWRAHRAEGALRGLSDECILQIIRDSESAAEEYDAGRPVSVVKTPCAAGSGLVDDGVLARVCAGVRWTFADRGRTPCRIPEPAL